MSAESRLSQPEPIIVVKSIPPYSKNTLQGFLTLSLPAVGIHIKDICLHEKKRLQVDLEASPFI